ncbi:MAG TPA: hypothetical protein VFH51_05020, partial [Myxococcota bacterium]|nr:hypothetical protein [Myxococcota bacterium]
FGVGKLAQKVVSPPKRLPTVRSQQPKGPRVAVIVANTVGSSITSAGFAAAGACLYNVTGCWVQSWGGHNGPATDFHGGQAQGNYAAMGAALAPLHAATRAVAKETMSPNGYRLFDAAHTFVAPFVYAAAEGALASLLGAHRGMDVQAVGPSVQANLAGAGFFGMFSVWTFLSAMKNQSLN